MNKKRLIRRLIVSPFILGLLIISYTFHCFRNWISFIRYGGEWITYEKDDAKRMGDIFILLKDQYEKDEQNK